MRISYGIVAGMLLGAVACRAQSHPAAAVTVRYQLPTAGNVSLALYDADGRMVRELLRAAPQAAGRHTIDWDGLDRRGQPAPAGTYTWKLLTSAGLEAEYLLSIGTSVGINSWPGVHGGPCAVTVAGDRMFMAGAGSETAAGLACANLDGQFRWSAESLNGWDAASDLAVVGDTLWIQYQGDGSLRAADAATGRRLEKMVRLRFPVTALQLHGAPSAPAPGFVPCPVVAYSPERGYGWKDATGIEGFTRNSTEPLSRTGHQATGLKEGTERAFLVDLPRYAMYPGATYVVRLHLGGSDTTPAKPDLDHVPSPDEVVINDCTEVHIKTQNKDWRGVWKRVTDPPNRVLEFNVDALDGQLEIGFYSAQKDRTFGFALRAIEIYACANRMDADEDQMVVASSGAGKLLWIQPPTNNVPDQAIVDWWRGNAQSVDVPGLQDIALASNGVVIAISGDRLVTLSREDQTPRVRVTGLEQPAFLAVDRSSGDILVAQAGASHQVVRFDRDFNRLAAYGRPGGRQQGRYVAEDFAGVAGIAADHRGGFLIAEWLAAPRRTAHFDGAGKLLREWLGGQMFYHSLGINPQNPGQVLHNSQFGSLVEYAVDYDRREATVVATWDINRHLDPVLFPHNRGFQVWMHPFTLSNQTYYASELATALVLKPDYEQGKLIPLAAVGSAPGINNAPTNHPWRVAAEAYMEAHGKPGWGLHAYRGFGYADLNSDGAMQPEEFNVVGDAGPWGTGYHDGGSGSVIGPDGTVWRWGDGIGQPAWYRVPAAGFTPAGLPIWNIAQRETGPKRPGEGTNHLWPGTDGRLYTVEYLAGDEFAQWWTQTYWEGHGFGWPATMLNGSVLRCRDAAGRLLWETSGHHSGGPDSPRGNVDLPWRIAGVVGDVIGLTSQTRQPCEFFTTDGLYIGTLFDRRAADGLPDYVYKWWRVNPDKGDTPDNKALLNYDMGGSGRLARRPNGDTLFFGAGWNNIPVYRVNGWDQLRRQQGNVRVKRPAQAAAGTGTGLTAEYFAIPDLADEPAARRVDAAIWFGFASKAQSGSRIPWPEPAITGKPFSVRWTGFVEPRFSEDTVIGFYDRDSGVRVWVGDELVIDAWEHDDRKEFSRPIPLRAGQRVPIKIEYRQAKPSPEAHLVWESLSQPITHIPTEFLYP